MLRHVSACVADVLRLKAVSAGVVVIQGDVTGRYLAMDQNGHLYGSVSCCFFFFTLLRSSQKDHDHDVKPRLSRQH